MLSKEDAKIIYDIIMKTYAKADDHVYSVTLSMIATEPYLVRERIKRYLYPSGDLKSGDRRINIYEEQSNDWNTSLSY